jgi:hypothetical protein
MGSRVSERLRTAAVSRWNAGAGTRRRISGRAWTLGALACATLRRGLSGVAGGLEGVARLVRKGAQQLDRGSAGARARASLAAQEPPAPAPAPAPGPIPAANPAETDTIVSAPAFLVPPPPLPMPLPRPQWGHGPALPPPRRAEWRAALQAKRTTAEATDRTQAAAVVDAPPPR